MLKINFSEVERLQEALKNFQGNAEDIINDVLHGEAGDLAQKEIYFLMPFSGAHWKGKKPAAKASKSLRNVLGNLSVTVTTTGNYGYLYFPDDGTSTRRHVGNQRFFERGGEEAVPEIVERCINNLINNFEKGV